ncbi:hypothetical protein C8F04DRAFT_1174696 [Mycena alexandri]|uniref:Uncharacterized protein n=1 Tax=Mycena alexandri TaxID=1745969 RepID=A0AAD6XDE6_9AGAR|nr:hypothetical protein C8F04DRAFT_1174696 [Mycena alexandri]
MIRELKPTSACRHSRRDTDTVEFGEKSKLVSREILEHLVDRNNGCHTFNVPREHVFDGRTIALKFKSILRSIPNHGLVGISNVFAKRGAIESRSASTQRTGGHSRGPEPGNKRSNGMAKRAELLQSKTPSIIAKTSKTKNYHPRKATNKLTQTSQKGSGIVGRHPGSQHKGKTRIWSTLPLAFDEGQQFGDFQTDMNIVQVTKSDELLKRFWLRVGDLCARSRVANGWVGTEELRRWNKENSAPCGRCLVSKDHKVCDVVDDHPSCLTCRNKKQSCDRRARFVFEHTKDEFFSDFEEFLKAFSITPPKEVQEIKRAKSRVRKTAIEALSGSNGRSIPYTLDVESGKKAGKKKKSEKGLHQRPLHTLLSPTELQMVLERLGSTRRQILSLRCELREKLASVGEPEATMDQLLAYTGYYKSALFDHQRYL